jgi:hypothetical protein
MVSHIRLGRFQKGRTVGNPGPLIKKGAKISKAFLQKLAQTGKMDQISAQKVLEMIPTAEDAAGVAGLTTASMMTPDEANAAGVGTIMSRLGVGLEEATKIKKLAAEKIPQSLFDENIRAIQEVSQFKKDPSQYKKLGHGVDYRAFETPSGNVLKQPKDLTKNNDILKVAPSLVEQAGLGPKTKNIQLGDKAPYMLQDKVTPLSDIFEKDPAYMDLDNTLNKLYRDAKKSKSNMTDFADSPKIKEIQNARNIRKNLLLKSQGITPDSLREDYLSLSPKERDKVGLFDGEEGIYSKPEDAFARLLEYDVNSKLKSVITPNDLHIGNVGLNANGKPIAFDTSQFENFKPENLTPKMHQSIMDANIATPEKKKALRQLLNGEVPVQETQSPFDMVSFKKAAAAAAMPTMESDLISKPLDQIKDAYSAFRQPIVDATSYIGRTAGENLALSNPATYQDTKSYGDAGELAGNLLLDPANLLAPGAGVAMGAADMGLLKEPELTPEEQQRKLAIDRLR